MIRDMHTKDHLILVRKEQRLAREVHTLKQDRSPLLQLLPATYILSSRALHNLKGPGQEAYKMQTLEDSNPNPIL